MAKAKQKLGPNQRKWLAALVSGEYRQGTDVLFNGRSYCCLGVACRITGMRSRKGDSGFRYFGDEFSHAPKSIVEYLALRGPNGSAKHGQQWSLISMNDTLGKTFKQIAEIVRSNPENYFTEPR